MTCKRSALLSDIGATVLTLLARRLAISIGVKWQDAIAGFLEMDGQALSASHCSDLRAVQAHEVRFR